MPYIITFAPGAVSAGTDLDLPAGSPPLKSVRDAVLFRGSDGTAAAAEVAVTVTVVDKDTIRLNVATLTRDLLTLLYEAEYELDRA